MGSNTDVSFGDVWTTSAWAIVLGGEVDEAHGTGLPGWTGVGAKDRTFVETPK